MDAFNLSSQGVDFTLRKFVDSKLLVTLHFRPIHISHVNGGKECSNSEILHHADSAVWRIFIVNCSASSIMSAKKEIYRFRNIFLKIYRFTHIQEHRHLIILIDFVYRMLTNFPAKMYILLYEKMSIYLCQKMYKQSYLLQLDFPGFPRYWNLNPTHYHTWLSGSFKAQRSGHQPAAYGYDSPDGEH